MTAQQVAEWRAFYSLEPLGERRADAQAALLACTMRNIWRGKNAAAAKLGDFMLDFEPRLREQSEDEMKRVLIQLTGMMGGEMPTTKGKP